MPTLKEFKRMVLDDIKKNEGFKNDQEALAWIKEPGEQLIEAYYNNLEFKLSQGYKLENIIGACSYNCC